MTCNLPYTEPQFERPCYNVPHIQEQDRNSRRAIKTCDSERTGDHGSRLRISPLATQPHEGLATLAKTCRDPGLAHESHNRHSAPSCTVSNGLQIRYRVKGPIEDGGHRPNIRMARHETTESSLPKLFRMPGLRRPCFQKHTPRYGCCSWKMA